MFWWILTAAFTLLAIHPFATYPLSLYLVSRARPLSPAPREASSRSRIAILFCAYNEEAVIAEKLANCAELCGADGNAAVFVYTDGCSDRTPEIVRSFGSAVHLIEGRERRGKSAGMTQLGHAARADGAQILFFTDANVILDPGALDAMRQEFTDSSVGCVTGHLVYTNSAESPTAAVGARYWSLDGSIKQLESETGSCMGADGSIFGIRAQLFRDVPEYIIDDFFTSMSVLCDGWRCIYSKRVIAFERSATRTGEEYRRKVRIACRSFNCHRLLWPRLSRMPAWNVYKYVSHKLLRWLVVFSLAGAGLSFCLGILTLGLPWAVLLLLALLGAGGVAAIAYLPGKPWVYGREAFQAFLATGVGVIKSLQGERFQTWTQAASTRRADTGLSEPQPS